MSKANLAGCACVLLLGSGSQGIAQANAHRNAYFGVSHYSSDAWPFGNHDRRSWIVGKSHNADIFGVVGDARETKRRVDPHAPEDIQKVYLNLLNMVTGPPVKALMAPGLRRSKRDGQFSYDPHVNAEFALVRIFPNSEGG